MNDLVAQRSLKDCRGVRNFEYCGRRSKPLRVLHDVLYTNERKIGKGLLILESSPSEPRFDSRI